MSKKLTQKEKSVRRALKAYRSLKSRGLCPHCCKPNSEGGVYHKACNKKRTVFRNNDTAQNNLLKRLYGITLNDYKKMLESQDNKCVICDGTSGKRRLSVDHDHKTGLVRGLLCDNCNHGLGKFQDNVELLKRAMMYLESYE